MVIPKILLIWMFFIFKIYTYYVHRYIRVHNNSIYAHLSFKIQNSVFFMCKLWHVSVIKVFLITADNVVILNRIYWILPTFLYFLLNFNITLLNMFFFNRLLCVIRYRYFVQTRLLFAVLAKTISNLSTIIDIQQTVVYIQFWFSS